MYKTDSGYCTKDLSTDNKAEKCDMHTVGQSHECKYGFVDCKMCYAYIWCEET